MSSASKKFKLAFEIHGLPKMMNQLLRGHWRVKHGHAVKWKELVRSATLGKTPKKPLKKASLTLTRCSSVEPDFDGLCSSFKHIIDSLVECGIIENDKMSNIGQPTFKHEKAPQRGGKIRVVIEEK